MENSWTLEVQKEHEPCYVVYHSESAPLKKSLPDHPQNIALCVESSYRVTICLSTLMGLINKPHK